MDLYRIKAYIAADRPQAAENMLDRIMTLCQDLAEWPESGRQRDEILPGIRSSSAGPYVVFFRRSPHGIQVIRVLHERQDTRSAF